MREDQQLRTTAAAEKLFSLPRVLPRRLLLPFVLSETPYIVKLQQWRTPFRDKLMQSVSFVGSHVFYMLWLPTLFWLGQAQYGRHLTILLALCLYICNYIKDMLCLPRPQSPPVVKLASNLYSIEYGFPSAHSFNAVIMAGFTAHYFTQGIEGTPLATAMWIGAATFVFSIAFSRIYCGMHTLTDITGGLFLGVCMLYTWLHYFPIIEDWITHSNYVFWGTALFAIVLTAVYPNPVDPTPSYDDTVSFIWVMVGVATGSRGFCGHPLSTPVPFLGNVRYSFAALGPLLTLARVAVGVAVVLSWRLVAKRVLLLVLPPIYKVLDLPARKFFLSAREYKGKVDVPIRITPSVLHMDPLPTMAEANKALTHRRTDSGDKGHRRTDSNGGVKQPKPVAAVRPVDSDEEALRYAFHKLPRYDVEVVTRCVVYFGIGWLSVNGIPVLFDLLGLAPPLTQ